MHKINLINIFLSADFLSKTVFFILMLMSFYCIFNIVKNVLYFKFLKSISILFMNDIWNDRTINIRDALSASVRYECGESMILQSVASILSEYSASPAMLKDAARNAMESRIYHIMDDLNARINIFALMSYISPFIGLFGTVWGIIVAFSNLGFDSSNMGVVFIGMSEALVATLLGLVIAIPSYCAHHYFSNKISVLQTQLEAFMGDVMVSHISNSYTDYPVK